MIDTAICFAAGKGERMRPFTESVPKPMLRWNGKTLLERWIENLVDAGVHHIVVNCHYKPESLVRMTAKRRFGVKITTLREEGATAYETGGGVVNALPHLGGGAFFAVNVDALFPYRSANDELFRLAGRWREVTATADAAGLLLMQPPRRCVGYDGTGDFSVDANGLLRKTGAPLYVFSGVQILSAKAFAHERPGVRSLSEFYRGKIDEGTLYGAKSCSPWLHIGSPAALMRAERRARWGGGF